MGATITWLRTADEVAHHLESQLRSIAERLDRESYAIYGAGRHTQRHLRRFMKALGEPAFILDDAAPERTRTIAGVPVLRPDQAHPSAVELVLVSSDAIEAELAARAARWAAWGHGRGPCVRRLYEGCAFGPGRAGPAVVTVGSTAGRTPQRTPTADAA